MKTWNIIYDEVPCNREAAIPAATKKEAMAYFHAYAKALDINVAKIIRIWEIDR